MSKEQEKPVKHNHITRDIKPLGKCPACDDYHDRHIPKAQPKPEHEKVLDHPCKQTCSGWRQGFDRGYDALAEKLKWAEYNRDHAVSNEKLAMEKYEQLVSYLPKVPTQPYEKELAQKNQELEREVERLKRELKEKVRLETVFVAHAYDESEKGLKNKITEQAVEGK